MCGDVTKSADMQYGLVPGAAQALPRDTYACHYPQFFWVFFWPCLQHLEVPGHGLNLHHNSDPSCSSDNTGSVNLLSSKKTPPCLQMRKLRYRGHIARKGGAGG